MSRNKLGQFASKTHRWAFLTAVIISIYMFFGHPMLMDWFDAQLSYEAEALVIEKVVEVESDKTVEKMKQDLIHIIWQEESGKYVPQDGEILPTFDPNSREYDKCVKRGGRMPLYCLSWGPMQIKLSTLIGFSEEVYGRTVSQKEARDIAEDLERAQDFFLQCSLKVKGCVYHWTKAETHRAEIELLIKYIREAEGITVE